MIFNGDFLEPWAKDDAARVEARLHRRIEPQGASPRVPATAQTDRLPRAQEGGCCASASGRPRVQGSAGRTAGRAARSYSCCIRRECLPRQIAPYQVQLDDGNAIWAPEDADEIIRAVCDLPGRPRRSRGRRRWSAPTTPPRHCAAARKSRPRPPWRRAARFARPLSLIRRPSRPRTGPAVRRRLIRPTSEGGGLRHEAGAVSAVPPSPTSSPAPAPPVRRRPPSRARAVPTPPSSWARRGQAVCSGPCRRTSMALAHRRRRGASSRARARASASSSPSSASATSSRAAVHRGALVVVAARARRSTRHARSAAAGSRAHRMARRPASTRGVIGAASAAAEPRAEATAPAPRAEAPGAAERGSVWFGAAHTHSGERPVAGLGRRVSSAAVEGALALGASVVAAWAHEQRGLGRRASGA